MGVSVKRWSGIELGILSVYKVRISVRIEMYYLGLCASVLELVVKIFSGVVFKLYPI